MCIWFIIWLSPERAYLEAQLWISGHHHNCIFNIVFGRGLEYIAIWIGNFCHAVYRDTKRFINVPNIIVVDLDICCPKPAIYRCVSCV